MRQKTNKRSLFIDLLFIDILNVDIYLINRKKDGNQAYIRILPIAQKKPVLC